MGDKEGERDGGDRRGERERREGWEEGRWRKRENCNTVA